MHLGCTKIRLINAFHRSAKLLRCCFKHFSDHLVFKNLLIAIHRINHYPLDSAIGFANTVTYQ